MLVVTVSRARRWERVEVSRNGYEVGVGRGGRRGGVGVRP